MRERPLQFWRYTQNYSRGLFLKIIHSNGTLEKDIFCRSLIFFVLNPIMCCCCFFISYGKILHSKWIFLDGETKLQIFCLISYMAHMQFSPFQLIIKATRYSHRKIVNTSHLNGLITNKKINASNCIS